jgi:hypothetical protein
MSDPSGARGTYYGNPVTGPLWIEGAAPGDTLAVHLHAMECDTLGFFGYWPFIYHLQDWLEEPFTGLVDIQGGAVSYTMQTQSGPHHLRVRHTDSRFRTEVANSGGCRFGKGGTGNRSDLTAIDLATGVSTRCRESVTFLFQCGVAHSQPAVGGRPIG